MEEEGGLNLYGFVGNDGINEVDSVGLRILSNKLEWDLQLPPDKNGKRKLKKVETHVAFEVSPVDAERCTVDVRIPVHFISGNNRYGLTPVSVNENVKEPADMLAKLVIRINAEIAKKWNRDDFRMCCDGCPKCNDGIKLNIFIERDAQGSAVALYNQDVKKSDEGSWNINDKWLPALPHEVGHLLGRPDEYNGPIRDRRKGTGPNNPFVEDTNKDNIMFDETGLPKSRHFSEIPLNSKNANCRIVRKGEKCK